MGLFFLYLNRNNISGNRFFAVLSFIVLPMTAAVIQVFIYGYSISNIACLIAGIIMFGQALDDNARTMVEKEIFISRQNDELSDLRTRIALSQIKPEFICESLNSVYELCDRDKERARGFNQAELLARFAAEEYERLSSRSAGYVPGLMQKTEATASMRTSDAVKRRSLLHTSFSLSSQYADIICNRKIILADDVVTTGSTADACARILKEAGAERVYLLCFASGSGEVLQEERRDPV